MASVNRVALGSISSAVIRRDKQLGVNNLSKLFDSGKFKINGAIVSITKGDSLAAIANKINRYTSRTGIKAEVVNNNQLVLKSKKTKVDITDYGPLFKIVKKGMLGTGDNCLLQIVKTESGDKISENVMINYSQGKKAAGNPNANPLLDGIINGNLAEVVEEDDEAARIAAEEQEQLRIIERICEDVKGAFVADRIRYTNENYTEENYNDLVNTMEKVRVILNTFNYDYLSTRRNTLAPYIFELLDTNRINNLILHPVIYWGGKYAITDDNWLVVRGAILRDYIHYTDRERGGIV
jgi:hypothetical protein